MSHCLGILLWYFAVLTMNFFEARFTWDGGSRMFMKRSEMTSQFKLFMNADFLITEDCYKLSAISV